ncbi:WG repeat-containing protein [Halocola ammonii]
MKIRLNIFLILLSTWLLNACASVKNTSDPNIKAERISSPVDTIFVDYKPNLPETKYQVFRASIDGKSGWMNVDGEWIVTPKYDNEFKREWSEGINICRKEGKYGAVNFRNEIVIPFEYDYPPANCSDGLILVKDSLNQEAYFSKQGTKMTSFEKRQPEFRNGFAIVRSNRKVLARYPRMDLENSNRTTDIYSGDFAVINTNFDTLLQFENVAFLLEFGTLNNNRRTFFLYPYMGLHADIGISYGQYGYLDGKGNIAIEPKFRASDVFIPVRGGFVRVPDCPFNYNLSLVRELDDYYFIDTIGNTSFQLHTNREKIFDVSNFNNHGIAGYRTFGKSTNGINPNHSMIHLIDSTGKVMHEAFESDAPLSYVEGNISHYPHNNLISIYDKPNAVQRIYTPDFQPFASFPLNDSSETVNYHYRGLFDTQVDDQFILTQYRSRENSAGYPGNQQRLVDKNGDAKSSWFSYKNILSSLYGNFSFIDSTTMTTTLYDFGKNELFKCDSCFFYYGYKLRSNGIHKVQLSNGDWVFINYQGKVLSDVFDSLDEEVYNLTEQVKTFNINVHVTIKAREHEFEKLFKQSSMYERIIN